ncbi:MAG: DUF2815 family protein [Firmicutes bacterium]|nr:DUF2815 family protein [Bacillota bacterium]
MKANDVTTGKVRLSYVHLFKPYAFSAGSEEKFSVTILLPKSDTATKARIDAAIEEAKRLGAADKWNGVVPPILATPVYDGDGTRPSDGLPFGDECKGHWVFTASSKADYPPEVVDANMNPIIDQSQIYSGIYAKVCVTFFPYLFGGAKKGIGCALGPVMKVADGPALGGERLSAAEAFGAAATPQQAAQPAAAPTTPQIDPITGLPM